MGAVQERIDRYSLLSAEVSEEDVYALVKICRLLHLPQKTLSISIYNFYHAKAYIQIEPDDIVLLSACIDLACRTSEINRPLEKILGLIACHCSLDVPDDIVPMYIECIDKTEVDMCVCMDFDFNFPDFYGRLEGLCREHALNLNYSRRCWIMINDILTTPVSLFFSVDDVVFGCIFVEFVASRMRSSKTTAADDRSPGADGDKGPSKDDARVDAVGDDIVQLFSDFLGINDKSPEGYLFISAELLEMYQNKLFSVK